MSELSQFLSKKYTLKNVFFKNTLWKYEDANDDDDNDVDSCL